jgi:hydroxyethylthiazole kinase-like uncharacterized protein yjeF
MLSNFILPRRNPNSHKGECGKLMIVSGSHQYYGAPIISALAAEKAGADLITLFLPELFINTARNYSLNFFLHSFVKGDLGLKDIVLIIEEANKNHTLVIGPGLGKDRDTIKALCLILAELNIPVVLDADALVPEILEMERGAPWVITPHKGEFKRLFGVEATEQIIKELANKHSLTIVVKGHEDFIASHDNFYLNKTGCPEMRVGGTGDALAGMIGSYISQGLSSFEAASLSAYYFGKAGEALANTQHTFSTLELVKFYPKFLKTCV